MTDTFRALMANVYINVCIIALITYSALASEAQAAQSASQRIAVLTLSNQLNLQSGEMKYLTAMVRGEVARRLSEDYLVMTEENLIALLPEGKLLEECVSDCQVTLGREIGASYIITGELVAFGESLRLFIRLHDTRSGRLISNEIAKAKTLEEIETPTQRAITRLLDRLTARGDAQARASTAKTSETARVVEPAKPKPESFRSAPAQDQESSPQLQEDENQPESPWSLVIEGGVTQTEPDDINRLSFGLGVTRVFSDHFHVGLNLHYGAYAGQYYGDLLGDDGTYEVTYLNLLPAVGARVSYQAWTFHAEAGLGFAVGSEVADYDSGSFSIGFGEYSVMFGGGVHVGVTSRLAVGLNIRLVGVGGPEIPTPPVFQNTLSLSWRL